MTDWWRCPNDPPCPHPGVVHDVYDLDDETPTCCAEGCGCGQLAAAPETHAAYPGSGLARCGVPIGARTVAPGEAYTCTACPPPA